MRRYWVEKKHITAESVQFSGDVFHHIFDVCRQTLGSQFEVLTEDSEALQVEVNQKDKKSAEAKIISRRPIQPLPLPHVHLVMSVCRYPVMDAVIEKAVELGVSSIQTFTSDFSFIRKNESLPPAKIDRWRKIIVSATQQSGRGDLMILQAPVSLEQKLEEFNRLKAGLGLFAYEGDTPYSLQSFIENQNKVSLKDGLNIENIWIFVGSEGGFSPTEVQLLEKYRLKAVTLGSQVLRVETACVTLVSVIKYAFNLWK